MTARVVPLYSKTSVRKAGEIIGDPRSTPEAVRDARKIVTNFRSAHGYPMFGVTVYVKGRAIAINPDAVVARRLKRLPTILDKLKRHPNMNVATMHDLGGSRVILANVEEVDELVRTLKASTRAQNQIVRTYDYIHSEPGPQQSGYRGVHLVYEYRASQSEFHGLRVEVQVRTELQHAWATAVETVDLFSRSELKYSRGDADLQRYFVIVSSLMANAEGTAMVPGAEGQLAELRDELAAIEARVQVLSLLQGYAGIVAQHLGSDRRRVLTLELDRNTRNLEVRVHETQVLAEERLADLEASEDENLDAVLVAVSKVSQLQAAYPNYFADTGRFVAFVASELS